MKKLLTLLIAVASVSLLQAQEFEVPDYKFDTESDYALYDQDVIYATDWLMSSPVDSERSKRTEAMQFIRKWTMGTPDVHFGLDPRIITFLNEYIPDYLIIYLGGWAKYAFDNKERLDQLSIKEAVQDIDCILAGLDAVMTFYEKNKSVLPKEKGIEKYLKLRDKGTLRAHVEKIYS